MRSLLFGLLVSMYASPVWAQVEMKFEFSGHTIERPMLNGKMFDASMESASFVCATMAPDYVYSEITATEPFQMNEKGLNTVDTIQTPNGVKFFVNHWQGLDQTPVLTGVRCYYPSR